MPPKDRCRLCRGSHQDPRRTCTSVSTSSLLAFSAVYSTATGLMSQANTCTGECTCKLVVICDRSLARAHARAPAHYSEIAKPSTTLCVDASSYLSRRQKNLLRSHMAKILRWYLSFENACGGAPFAGCDSPLMLHNMDCTKSRGCSHGVLITKRKTKVFKPNV
jgi:hypothetical protein